MKICNATVFTSWVWSHVSYGKEDAKKWKTVAAGSRVLNKIFWKTSCEEGKFCLSQIKLATPKVSR